MSRHEAARVHHAARRRGGVAARGARAAAERCRRSAAPAARGRPDDQAWSRHFLQAWRKSGWTDGRNLRIDDRWADSQCRRVAGSIAAELAALAPDVILAHAGSAGGRRCDKRPAPSRSCSRSAAIRSAPAWSTAWRGRAAMPPAFMTVRVRHRREMAGAAQARSRRTCTRAAVLRDPTQSPTGIGQFGAIAGRGAIARD